MSIEEILCSLDLEAISDISIESNELKYSCAK